MGGAQAKALGYPGLPIAVIPHPFGIRTRDEIRGMAGQCADDIARLMCEPGTGSAAALDCPDAVARAALIEVPGDLDEFNRFFHERRWSDGMPVIPPTAERVARMLRATRRAPAEIAASIAPAFGTATVERIAINAVLAGCYPEYLPVLIAAAEAVAAPEFNLQSIQTTTNPVTVWLIVNGPIARHLGVNSGINCLGPGAWANATLGRALRLILQNIGGGLPGDMDRATHGQPGKYTFCCAENEEANPWEPLHVERGLRTRLQHGDGRGRGGHVEHEHARKGRGRLVARDRGYHDLPRGERLHFRRRAMACNLSGARAYPEAGWIEQSRRQAPPVGAGEVGGEPPLRQGFRSRTGRTPRRARRNHAGHAAYDFGQT